MTSVISETKSALLVIDFQVDFCEGGGLAVPDGSSLAPILNDLKQRSDIFDLVVLSKDWHPLDHVSFASNHSDAVPFTTKDIPGIGEQMMWPVHCVQGSPGSEFHPSLLVAKSDIIVYKGEDSTVDSYSAFFDNDHHRSTGLHDLLEQRGVTSVFCCGLAADYCVKFTALDAAELGYNTYYIVDATKGITEQGVEEAHEELDAKGVHLISSSSLLSQ